MGDPSRVIVPYTIAGLFVLAVLIAGWGPSETHTTYINGSRVQSPSFNATGNISVGANSSTYLDNWGGRFNQTNITRANISALNAPMDAAGYAVQNAVIKNATIGTDTRIANKMTTLHLIPRNATGNTFIPGVSIAEMDPTYRASVDFATVNYSLVRFVADIQGSNATGDGKCLSITRQGGGGGDFVVQCWSGNARIQQLISNWTSIETMIGALTTETSIGFKLNGSSATESISIRGLEVQLR